jgi:hypothetical protein
VGRTVALGLVLAVAAWFLVQAIVTTDREAVEAEIARLVALARQGGDDAVLGILDALAPDYRGTHPFTRESIEENLRHYLEPMRLDSLSTGDPSPVWKGEEIFVPILSIQAKADGAAYRVLLSVTFAERDGSWKIVSVSRAELGR